MWFQGCFGAEIVERTVHAERQHNYYESPLPKLYSGQDAASPSVWPGS